MVKKFAIILMMVSIHFGASVLIVAASQSIATALDPVTAEPTVGFRLLVAATRIVHFPIISLSLYSRQWFPGNWLYVPMLVNSFIWAAGLYGLFLLGKKLKEKKRNGS
jgi:hypothetical protein